jgi:hypothetical protein
MVRCGGRKPGRDGLARLDAAEEWKQQFQQKGWE